VYFQLEDAMSIFYSSPRVGTIWNNQDLMKEIAKYKGFVSSPETRGWISYFIGTIEFLRCSTQHGTISVNAAKDMSETQRYM